MGYGKPTEDPVPAKDLLKASAPSIHQGRHGDRCEVLALQALQAGRRVDEASADIGGDWSERLNHLSHRNEEIMSTWMRSSAPS
jgi:hypothetical protein